MKIGRIWTVTLMVVYPIISYIETRIFMESRQLIVDLVLCLLLILGGFFIPVYVVGKKYE